MPLVVILQAGPKAPDLKKSDDKQAIPETPQPNSILEHIYRQVGYKSELKFFDLHRFISIDKSI